MYKYILIVGDPDNGGQYYVGMWDNPTLATAYAQKELKGKKWLLDTISLVAE